MGEPHRKSHHSNTARIVGFWAGIIAFALTLVFGSLDSEHTEVSRMAAVALLMAIWWITDAIPLAATALLPLLLYPTLGIMTGKETAPVYFNYIIFLFIGGFLIALAMERWNLHRRIALAIITFVGSRPSQLVLGFMIATAFLSMWISNTATSIMMLAISLAVIKQAEDAFGAGKTRNLSLALLLGVAYSASIGGLATLVGTPPNLALVRIFALSFPGAEAAGSEIAFGQWMLFGVPLMLIMLATTWLILTRLLFRSGDELTLDPETIRKERDQLGPMSCEEKMVAVIFAATALLWIFRKKLEVGSVVIPGWSDALPFGKYIDDGTIAIGMAIVLFCIPSRRREEGDEENSHRTLLDTGVFAKLPWHIILLFGGGFALASGFKNSGLSEWIGQHFAGMEGAPEWLLVGAVTGGITFLTELTSNTATTEMILPILASIASAAKIHPLVLMVPAALAASCAFMMPVATPPNAIVFASGRIRIADMVKAGLIINLISIIVVTAIFLLLGPAVFQIDPDTLPDWAKASAASP
jgi:sodium-dependent dicarboxylate transporter 2/3/5